MDLGPQDVKYMFDDFKTKSATPRSVTAAGMDLIAGTAAYCSPDCEASR